MGKILLWLQERLKHWTKPAVLPLIPGLLSDLTRSFMLFFCMVVSEGHGAMRSGKNNR